MHETSPDDIADRLNMKGGVNVIVHRLNGKGRREIPVPNDAADFRLYLCTPDFIVACRTQVRLPKPEVSAAAGRRTVLLHVEHIEGLDRLYAVDPARERLCYREAIHITPRKWCVRGPYDTPGANDAVPAELLGICRDVVRRNNAPPAPESEPTGAALSRGHLAYLSLIEGHIATIDRHDAERIDEAEYHFVSLKPVTMKQYSNSNTYALQFTTDHRPPYAMGDYIRLRLDDTDEYEEDLPEHNVNVVGVDEGKVDYVLSIRATRQLNVHGATTGVVYQTRSNITVKKQRDALRSIRQGLSLNPHLLPCIVDGAFRPLGPELPIGDGILLKKAQREVLGRGPASDDIFLVMGPPGTGKTQTITELVRYYKSRRMRVLLTSKNNMAVDNVLIKLKPDADPNDPAALRMVRLGQRRISDDTIEYSIDAQATKLQQQIQERTQGAFEHLRLLSPLWAVAIERVDHLIRLRALMHETLAAAATADAALQALHDGMWEGYASLGPLGDEATTAYARATASGPRRRPRQGIH